jgi:putative RecB family exonuclease
MASPVPYRVTPRAYDAAMEATLEKRGYPVPTNLSPSRVDAFTSCPLQFRFASIQKLPEPPSVPATKGSLVHRSLELLFERDPQDRTLEAALTALDVAATEFQSDPEWIGLGLDSEGEQRVLDDAEELVRKYFTMEDPRQVTAIGVELRLEVPVGSLHLRGIIDRLDRNANGELIVVDYKTGRPPRVNNEQSKLGGVNFYAYLCQQFFGQRPAEVRLMYLSTGETIVARPTEQSVSFLPKRTLAVWGAVEKACSSGTFQPRPGPLCNYCSFQAWCPAFGGDPDRAELEAFEALDTAQPAAS